MSTLSRRKRPYHHGDLEAALVRAAGKLLDKEGIEALSLREVARRAGVSHAAPYRHFPERDALLAARTRGRSTGAACGRAWRGGAPLPAMPHNEDPCKPVPSPPRPPPQ